MIDIFLGILQGITEFLPVSSSGHLVIFSSLFKENNLSTNEIAFLHLGTVLSILFFYYKDLLFSNLELKEILSRLLCLYLSS